MPVFDIEAKVTMRYRVITEDPISKQWTLLQWTKALRDQEYADILDEEQLSVTAVTKVENLPQEDEE
jgi:hypothetical protein